MSGRPWLLDLVGSFMVDADLVGFFVAFADIHEFKPAQRTAKVVVAAKEPM